MKKLLLKVIAVGSVCLLTTSLSFADTTAAAPNTKMWVCKTNASSAASGSAAANADKEMTTAKAGDAAFAFAYTNCRDCTKITCKSQ